MIKTLIIVPALLVMALVIGLFVAENVAHDDLESELRVAVRDLAPAEDIRETNVRGRPYLLSAYREAISTAYVEVAAPAGATRARLLVQELDLDTHDALAVRTFIEVAYPDSEAPLAANASETSATLTGQGRSVTYGARVSDDAVVFSAEGGATPLAVPLALAPGSEVVAVTAAKDALMVEIVARDVSLTSD